MTLQATLLTRPQDISTFSSDWKQWWESSSNSIQQHPDWLLMHADEEQSPLAVAVREGEEVKGVLSFLMRRKNWPARLGYASVAQFPVCVAEPNGPLPLADLRPEAQEAAVQALVSAPSPLQMIYFESMRIGSPEWKLIHHSSLLRRHFWVYQPNPPTPHHLIRMNGSFDDYLASFNGPARRKLKNKARKIEKEAKGTVRFQIITEKGQVADFLRKVEIVSEKSWQGRKLGVRISAESAWLRRLERYAERGWLRSYLLLVDEDPVAFAIGYQLDGVYHYDFPAYDPKWSACHPGTALLYRLVEDLFSENKPNYLDFGYGDNLYKQIFANYTYEDANVYLIRKSPYTGLARMTHGACAGASASVRRTLDALKMRDKVRQILRGKQKTGVASMFAVENLSPQLVPVLETLSYVPL